MTYPHSTSPQRTLVKLLLTLLALSTYLLALEPIATLTHLEGKVKVLSHESIKKHTATLHEALYAGDKLITYANAKACITLADTSTAILDANAELLFTNETHLRQASGEIYYNITKRPKHKGLQVQTPFSIIGIKGTEFIVNFKNEGSVALNEGLVGITSPDAAFELYQEKTLSDFEKFQAQQQRDFESYKQKFEDQIAAYVTSFDLQSKKMLTFNTAQECDQECEKQVVEAHFSQAMHDKFKSYQKLKSSWK